MTSTTLNYKGGFKAAFTKTFKQQLPGAIILTALSLLISIGSAATTIMDNATTIESTEYPVHYDALVIASSMGTICIVYSLFLAMLMFKEIYSKRACDTFFALPIKRSEYFGAKYLFGALMNVIPILLAVVVQCVMLLSASTKLVEYTFDFNSLLCVLPAIIFNVLAIYSVLIFCAVLAGKRLHYFFFAVIALIAPMCVTNGILEVINSIWGAYASSYLLTIIHPVQSLPMLMLDGFGYYGYYEYYEFNVSIGQYLPMILVGIVESIAFFFGGYLVFKRRRAEVAEFTPAGKVVPFVFLAFLIAAELMQNGSSMSFVKFLLVSIAAAVIATMLFSAIFYKKVFTKNTLITTAVTAAVCILFVGIVTLPNYTNYVKYVPEADEVESVELIDGSMEVMNYTSYSFYTNPLPSYEFEENGGYKFTTAENIESAIALHKKIVDDETIEKGKALNSDTWNDMMDYNYEYENSYECRIVYHLKNGKTVTRYYAVPAKMIVDEMVTLMKNEEALNQIGITAIDYDDLLYAVYNKDEYNDEDVSNRTTRDLTEQEFKTLLSAYKEDILNTSTKSDFLDYISMYTSYYVDTYTDRYSDKYDDTYMEDDYIDNYTAEDEYWVYMTYFYPGVSAEKREYYRDLGTEELDRMMANSAEYFEDIASDSFYIRPADTQTYKYAQSIGLID